MSYPNWGRAKLVKIRNERKCRYCSNNIAPGEQAVKEEYFFPEEVIPHYSHLECYIQNESYDDQFIKKIDDNLKKALLEVDEK